jgi:outer membrane protein assembly factor BamB
VPGGVERVDINPDGRGCTKVWHSDERAPSVVPKLSRGNGLVYVYTKDPQPDGSDTWYLTAIDFGTGQTIYKRLAGEGLGYNNHYAPITIAQDGTVYVGVLGGLVRIADGG